MLAGNTAINLSAADLFATLYFTELKHQPQKPEWKNRDRIFVTKQLEPSWQSILAQSGYYAKKDLLQPTREKPKGQVNPLGTAVGSALATKMDGKKHQTYCMITDSEHQNGKVWEAALIAGSQKLNNITLIVDRNNIQTDGYSENIVSLEPLRAKYEAFNWHAIEVDGHNTEHIKEALQEAKANTTQPSVIIAHTIPGKGVSFMENRHEWHNKVPDKHEEEDALKEL